mmetsp:Transcript_2600/g.6654  ORF Transcript_2600/g.6654 Transcript_2600/m.6654 type:complete len:276 (-) Transcript_2600:49-876(-)
MGAGAVVRAAEFVAPVNDPKRPVYNAPPIRPTVRGARRGRPNAVKQTAAKALVVLALEANVGSPDAEKRTRITTPQQPVSQATSEAVIVEARRGREKMLCEFKALDGSGSTHHEGDSVLSRGVLRDMLARVCMESGLTDEPLDTVLDVCMGSDATEVSYERLLKWLYQDDEIRVIELQDTFGEPLPVFGEQAMPIPLCRVQPPALYDEVYGLPKAVNASSQGLPLPLHRVESPTSYDEAHALLSDGEALSSRVDDNIQDMVIPGSTLVGTGETKQ